jgi:hypothetical protein
VKFDLTQKQAAELIREITMKYLNIDASLTSRNSRIVEEMLDDLIESVIVEEMLDDFIESATSETD